MLFKKKYTLSVNLILLEGVGVVCESLQTQELCHLLRVPLARLTGVRTKLRSMAGVLTVGGAFRTTREKIRGICGNDISTSLKLTFICPIGIIHISDVATEH